MANLLELFDNVVEFQNYNGVPLAAGKMYVYALGRTRLMDTWSDIDGESLNPNPIILDDLGQCHCYVSDSFDYTIVVCDQFDNEIFSVDKYLLSKGEHSHADVAVAPSEHIGVSSYHVGEVTVYVPYLTGEVGKVYEGIDPIVVNNDVNRISANHIPLGVQDPLYFVEDSETACIIGCSAQTEIPSALSSKWDEASDAVIANSAQWAEGTEYEAGNYISIDNNTLSVTGLTPVPSDTASTGLVAQVSADITAMIPDTSDMATQTWVNEQGFLTAHQDISNKLDTTAFSTVSGDFLTAIPSEYVTENTLQSGLSSKLDSTAFSTVSGNFLTAHQSLDGLMSADLLEISDNKITGYNGTAFAGQGGTANPQIPVTSTSGISIFESGDQVYFNISADYATEDWVTAQGYLTAETDWTNTITAASANAYNEATAAIPTGLATTGDLQTVSGEITAMIPSTAGLATEDWVTGQGYITNDAITGKQDITGMTAYATVDSLTAKQDAGNYLSATDSANFLLTSDSGNFYPMNENPSGYLTAHQSLADYQTTAGMTGYQEAGDYYSASNPSGFISEVPDTYLQNTDLSTADGKVTAISGIPLSAGGDVPEGVMVESGLEYNAVQEISAYNGSAIAQYGAEKQWLVHDDTLVHASNSAQYALGVNLSAVAQLLGVDETVLFSGSTQSPTLNDSIWNYKKIMIYVGDDTTATKVSNNQMYYTDDIAVNGSGFSIFQTCKRIDGGYVSMAAYLTVTNGGSGFAVQSVGGWASWDNSTCSYNGAGTWAPRIYKVIGIGRKA